MAFIQCDFYSEILGTRKSLNAIIPLANPSDASRINELPEQYPVLFLLHGLHSNYSVWSRYSSVERYANERGIAIVMPDAGRSFYTNMRHGYRYFDFFANELPRISNQLFPLSTRRSDRFVAGLSMGGFGAFKLALSCPEQYAAAASLSGALTLSNIEDPESLLPEWRVIFGETGVQSGSENDLAHLAKAHSELGAHPLSLYQCCGTEDYLYPSNQKFLEGVSELNLNLTYEEGPGEHNWDYWDAQIRRVIEWLPIQPDQNR